MLAVDFGRDDGDVGSQFVLEAESHLRTDDGVGVGHVSPVGFPLFFPRLFALHGVGVCHVGHVGSCDGCGGHRGEVVGPVESGTEAYGVGVLGEF